MATVDSSINPFGTDLDIIKMDQNNNISYNHVENGLGIQKKTVNLSDLRNAYDNQKTRFKEADASLRSSENKAFNFKAEQQTPEIMIRPKHTVDKNLMELIRPYPTQARINNQNYPYQIMGDVFSSSPGTGTQSIAKAVDTPRFGRRSGTTNTGFNADFLVHHDATKFNTNQNCIDTDQSTSVIKLPANIRHSFGSRLCDELLSDQTKVSETLERQQRVKRPRTRAREEIPNILENPLNPYEDLGLNTRLNVFPNLSVKNPTSATKSNFDESVFLNRIPDTDKYRIVRDELSTWSERNVIRERLKKAWDQTHEVASKN